MTPDSRNLHFLPKYDNPPLVETVLSVQFEPISGLTPAHIGLFWSKHHKPWPKILTQPPIERQLELFDEEDHWLPQRLQFSISRKPEVRVQMLNENDDRMIQLQQDRLAYNWRRQREEEDYPHYDTIRLEFDDEWRKLQAFVSEHKLGNLVPRQWEVIYIDHIEKGELWNSPQDWAEIIPGLLRDVSQPTKDVDFRTLHAQWVFELGVKLGRLYIEVAPGQKADNPAVKLLVLRFTARGPVSEENTLDYGLNLGHSKIVESFDRIISDSARIHWKRHDDAHGS